MVSDEKKEAEEKSEKIDLREKKLRELDRPVVFQLYSKYMKDDHHRVNHGRSSAGRRGRNELLDPA